MLRNYSPLHANTCPKCHADQSPNTLVCTVCGHNFRVVLYSRVIDEPPAPKLTWTQQPLSVSLFRAKRFIATTGGALALAIALISGVVLCAILRAARPLPPLIIQTGSITPLTPTDPDAPVVLTGLHYDSVNTCFAGVVINRTDRAYHECTIRYAMCNSHGDVLVRYDTNIWDMQPGSTSDFYTRYRPDFTAYRIESVTCYD